MKNRAVLTLSEQLIAILVIIVAMAICLQIFVYSGSSSQNNEDVAEATVMAQNAAEKIKNCGGDLEMCAERFGYLYENGGMSSTENGLSLIAKKSDEGNEYYGKNIVSVYNTDNQLLIQLSVSYQKEAES